MKFNRCKQQKKLTAHYNNILLSIVTGLQNN